MPNILTGNPWVLDTPDVNVVLYNFPIRIEGMEWNQPTAIGHEVEVTDAAGKLVWTTRAAAANVSVSPGFAPGWIEGLRLTRLTSGRLTITLG